MTHKKRKRSGYDLSDWLRDNPGKDVPYLIEHPEEFFDPEHPEDMSTGKRVWTWDEISHYGETEPETPPQAMTPSAPENREVIIAGSLCDVVDDAVKALDNENIFSQGGYLVKVIKTDHSSVSIREFNPIGIADSLSRSATWRKWQKDKKTGEPTLVDLDGPPDKIAKAVVSRGEYKNIHTIKGITEAPFLRKTGTICQKHGFDHESGFYLNMDLKIRQLPKRPTLEQAQKCLNILRDPFSEFPFIDEQSRMIPVALILTVMSRPMLGNIPAFILDASTRGSGKTLISDIVSIILSGRPSPKFSWPTGRDYNIELEKTMNTAAMMGVPLMCFDNIPAVSSFGGAIMEKFITCNGRVNFRKLGSNDNRDVFFNTAIVANGNNILDGIQDETRRRALPCRMVPDCEKPEDRTGFKHNPLSQYVADNRIKFIESALLILKYSLQNPPAAHENWGSFEEFSKIIPHAIMAAGGPNILKTRDLVPTSGGDENDAMVNLFDVLSRKFIAGFRAKDIITKSEADDELKDALESVFYGQVPNSTRLGKRLRTRKDRLHNGMKIMEVGKSSGAVLWNIVKTNEQLEINTSDDVGDDY